MMTEDSKATDQPLDYTFDHVLLYVTDEEVSKRFYVEQLGLKLLADKSEHGLYTVGTSDGFAIAIHQTGEDETGKTIPTGTESIHFDLDVPDVDEAYATLQERGVKFLSPPKDMPWGERHTWLNDPDGYVIGLASPIKK